MSAELKQEQLLIPGNVVMNGFCYDYSTALHRKLASLMQNDRAYTNEIYLTALTKGIMLCLSEQTKIPTGTARRDDLEKFYYEVQEFLAEFEKL
jgi:hypothetical protein